MPANTPVSRRRQRRRRIAAATSAIAMSIGAAAFSANTASAGRDGNPRPPGNPKGQLIDLQLLGINDYHGHVEASTAGTLPAGAAGGSEYLSAKLNELRQGNKYSLTVAAGDLIGGSPAFSGLFHDEPSVETLNAMQLDVSSVGNHEFDEGVTELLRMQNGGCHPVDGCYFPDEPYPGADFQWLAANVINETTGETPLPPYWIERVQNVKVGFIGMTLEATDTLVAAAGIQGWDFLDEAETANALVPILRRKGVEAIVVLLHEGGSQTPPPGDVDACVGISGPIVAINDALHPEIDVVITGHTHLPYNCVLADPAGRPRIVTSAYSFGRVVTEVNLVLDKRTKDVRRNLSTSTNHAVIQADLTPDPAMTSIIEKWTPLFAVAGNTPVGTITADINRGGNPPGTDRGVESAAGNLVADAQLWATSSNFAEIAFMNPGGVRSDLTYLQSRTPPEGDGVVTFGEAFTFQPFGNTLVTYAMTGAQIISALEEQCKSTRPFLHLGVSTGFTYDLKRTITGGICTSISVTNVKLNGVPLDPTALYDVTVNSFLAGGGDSFTTFAAVTTPKLDGGNDLQALVNYLGTFSPVAPPSTDRVNELP
ncbi:MAG TPA: bifunctional metallophosphatase/5'-nucleotidase [Ilumatobacteraceae bacterium]|nr:bifunctional metallophosphatase/5'-nucleotidase [Ilumatobacteraceae bacterium]